jgi:hypothetical protein
MPALPVVLMDDVIDDAVRFVNMSKSAVAQAARPRIIFFACDVIVRFVEQFQRAMKTAAAVQARIDRRMIVQVLAVIDGGVLDFADSLVDLIDGVLLLVILPFRVSKVAQMGAGVTQIGQRVQICRMSARIVSEAQGRAQGE